ncbi:TPA: SAM-dependent chlorinase/fluorinase [Candidatus Woesearchaeota archaeon]|nr:SAM-dependent chlorinase/fluorinase [Candidatus Woesearchaeota archaeon]
MFNLLKKQKIISLTTDFGVQTRGIGIMHGTIMKLCPDAKVIDLMHGIPDFDLITGARALETVYDLPIGCHVCVIDPGVGTERRGIIIQTTRGDYLIGPDNGVLLPATKFLNGIKKIVKITNTKYMNNPVSPIFHGRDVFAPAAAHLLNGVNIKEFGSELKEEELVKAPYDEASLKEDSINTIKATIIDVNKFGSFHLNINHETFDTFLTRNERKLGDKLILLFRKKKLLVTIANTFGEVARGKELIMKDDYGRVEVAINQGSFIARHKVKVGDKVTIKA